jgi:hypothetical protein
MQAVKRVVRKFVPRPIEMPSCPVPVEQSAYSAMFSLFDEPGRPSQRLIDLGIDAVERAMKDVEVEGSIWSGEELRLLGGLMLAMRPKVVAEIGETNARASEVMKKYLPEGAKFLRGEHEISSAEFILVSGPGDGKFEESVLERLGRLRFEKPPIVMFNDTRRWEMLRFCREIRYPKLDLTSFGRWTGTLLVELTR